MDKAIVSSSSPVLSSCKYDVFISFRGADTRSIFVSHLHEALRRKRVQAYKDDQNLPRGEEISGELLEAIERSRISIVVLSKQYATSRWCLEEVCHILKCKRERGHVVLPVFYGIDPSNVRKQEGSFGEAFVDHEKRFQGEIEKVIGWRDALKEIGNLSGWDSRQIRSESELVEEIAQVTLLKLYNMSSSTSGDGQFNRNLVGIEERISKIEPLLFLDSPDVRIIGIWGMGGIGKTTIAEVLQKHLSSRFNNSLFIDFGNEVKRCGLRRLMNEFFATLLKEKEVDMSSSFTDVRVRRSKVFVVLDNVDDLEDIEHLIGVYEEAKTKFGSGSRIVITSRDKKLLLEMSDDVYEVDALDSGEALRLFYQNAFRRDSSRIMDFVDPSRRVVDYAGGNPLALKVLGSHLRSRSVEEWESALSELRNSPNEKILNVLRISYDALDRMKRSIFLDIACFLKGERREVIEGILEDESRICISVLVEKCLVTLDAFGRIQMHDLIQEMAWEIVRRESSELGQRSRLWSPRDVYSLFKRNKGSSKIEGISLDLSEISSDLCLRSTVFEAMENLRILKIYNSHSNHKKLYFRQDLEYLPDSLRYLHWSEYPLKSLPSDFEPQNLVSLNMSDSSLEKLWNGVQDLGNLREIDLKNSKNLLELPDLSRTPKLKFMNLSDCRNLRRFPKISKNLNRLTLFNSGIEEFHPSFESLENLERLNLSYCDELKRAPKFPRNIRYLYFAPNTNGNDSHISSYHMNLHSVESLELSGNTFRRMPLGIKHMKKLKDLRIINCKNLEYLQDLPCSLQLVESSGCDSLKTISVHGCATLKRLDAAECVSLVTFGIDKPSSGESWEEIMSTSRKTIAEATTYRFSFFRCPKLEQSARENILALFQREVFLLAIALHRDFKVMPRFRCNNTSTCYPGNEIPMWFRHRSEGSSVHVKLHPNRKSTNFVGFAISIILGFDSVIDFVRLNASYVSCDLRFKTRHGMSHYTCPMIACGLKSSFYTYSSHKETGHYVYMWYCYSRLTYDIEEALFKFGLQYVPIGNVIEIKKCGVRMISLSEAEEFGVIDAKKCQVPKFSISLRRRLKIGHYLKTRFRMKMLQRARAI